jgi:hypothetical protein
MNRTTLIVRNNVIILRETQSIVWNNNKHPRGFDPALGGPSTALGVTQRFFLAFIFPQPIAAGARKNILGHFAMAKRGRPTKEPSAEDRAKVAELLAVNSPVSELARLFGYSAPTFRKYFSAELFAAKKLVEKPKVARRVTDDMREGQALHRL